MVKYLVIAIIICVIILLAWIYNLMFTKKNKVKNSYLSIDIMLKKRFDMIPNLYDLVKNYMEHEKSLLEGVTWLRTMAEKETLTDSEKNEISEKMDKLLREMKVTVENYPDIKANQNFLHLQAVLNEVEEQISAARRTYNANATEFNNFIGIFPVSLFALLFRFNACNLFEATPDERVNRAWFR